MIGNKFHIKQHQPLVNPHNDQKPQSKLSNSSNYVVTASSTIWRQWDRQREVMRQTRGGSGADRQNAFCSEAALY